MPDPIYFNPLPQGVLGGLRPPPTPNIPLPRRIGPVTTADKVLAAITGMFGMPETGDEDIDKWNFVGSNLSTLLGSGVFSHMMPMMGITKFLKMGEEGAMVPDVAARMMQTKNNLENLKLLAKQLRISDTDAQAMQQIAMKYPRTFAHVEDVGPVPLRDQAKYAGVTHIDDNGSIRAIDLNPTGSRSNDFLARTRLGNLTSTDPTPVASTFAHELQHAAQLLGAGGDEEAIKKLGAIYSNIPYDQNPLELAARVGQMKRLYGVVPLEAARTLRKPETRQLMEAILQQKLIDQNWGR